MSALTIKARKPFVRTPYNYDREQVSYETGILPEQDDMAQQSFKDECDINTIVKRFGLTGQLPVNAVAPTYSMFDGVFDYHTAMNAIAEAREAFDAMPAEVRARFENDPQKFVEFCSDEKNLDEMRKLGLAIPEIVKETIPLPDDPDGSEGNSDDRGSKKRVGKGAKAPVVSKEDNAGE